MTDRKVEIVQFGIVVHSKVTFGIVVHSKVTFFGFLKKMDIG
jgi:hypothetical protein